MFSVSRERIPENRDNLENMDSERERKHSTIQLYILCASVCVGGSLVELEEIIPCKYIYTQMCIYFTRGKRK